MTDKEPTPKKRYIADPKVPRQLSETTSTTTGQKRYKALRSQIKVMPL